MEGTEDPLSLVALSLVTSASAGTFEHVRDVDGCSIAMRSPSDPEGAAMRAECAWPEVPAERLVDLLAADERYPEFVFPIDRAEVRRVEPDRALVWQRQRLFGMADREVLLWRSREDLADGGARFSWTTAAEEPLVLAAGSIRTPKNTGFWQVVPEAGGSRVTHEIALDAGGSVPAWIVDLVRTRSFAKIMSDVRSKAREPT